MLPPVALQRYLLGEVAVLDHAGQFGKAFQRQFTPLAAHLGPAQCLHEVAGFVLQQAVGFGQGLEVGGQGTLRLPALVFHAADLRLGLAERLADRSDQILDGLLALAEFVLCADAVLLHVLVGELQELRGAVLQCSAGQRAEGILERGRGLLEQRLLLRRGPAREAVGLDQARVPAAQFAVLAAFHQVGGDRTDLQ